MLVTYTAGPLPNEEETEVLEAFLMNGGTWVSFHGSAGGFAEKPRKGEGNWRRIKKFKYHELSFLKLSFFSFAKKFKLILM